MKFTEDELKKMAMPLSASEEEQCRRAIRMVASALRDIGYSEASEMRKIDPSSPSFSIRMERRFQGENIQLLVQGSYANNTNIRGESDVDIAVIDETHVVYGVRTGLGTNEYYFNNGDSGAYWASVLRTSVSQALKGKFYGVTDGDKSIKVPGNTNRKSADVVPCIRFADLTGFNAAEDGEPLKGVVLHALSGTVIVNYPEVHITAGRAKNAQTNHWYKKMVRIEKHVRSMLVNQGYTFAKSLSSFGVESLVFNVPDSTIMACSMYMYRFKAIVDWLYYHRDSLSEFTEANGVKYLCPDYATRACYRTFIELVHDEYVV